jgi:hypothetical protein
MTHLAHLGGLPIRHSIALPLHRKKPPRRFGGRGRAVAGFKQFVSSASGNVRLHNSFRASVELFPVPEGDADNQANQVVAGP